MSHIWLDQSQWEHACKPPFCWLALNFNWPAENLHFVCYRVPSHRPTEACPNRSGLFSRTGGGSRRSNVKKFLLCYGTNGSLWIFCQIEQIFTIFSQQAKPGRDSCQVPVCRDKKQALSRFQESGQQTAWRERTGGKICRDLRPHKQEEKCVCVCLNQRGRAEKLCNQHGDERWHFNVCFTNTDLLCLVDLMKSLQTTEV